MFRASVENEYTRMELIREFKIGKMEVSVYNNRLSLGKTAAKNVAHQVNKLLNSQEKVRIIFAAAPSQNEFLEFFVHQDVDWSLMIAFHMDEYISLEPGSPQLFSKYLEKNLFSKVNFGEVHLIDSANSVDDECKRYSKLIEANDIDITCMGIGENGHIAFNDPPVADFNDSKTVKVVELDETCRQQQVNDGCFKSIADVPTQAITLTVPTLMSARYISCVVPGPAKANAVLNTIRNDISEACPSTILRTHTNCNLLLDTESAKLL